MKMKTAVNGGWWMVNGGRRSRSLLLAFVVFLAINHPLSTIPSLYADPTGAAFIKVNPSPRSYALAGSNIASSFGAEGAYTNPAGLAAIDRRYEVFSSFSSMLEGASYSHVSFGINRDTSKKHIIDGLGFNYTRLGVGDLEARDRSGQATGSFSSQENFSLSLVANNDDGVIRKQWSLATTMLTIVNSGRISNITMETEERTKAIVRAMGCFTFSAYLSAATDVVVIGYAHAHHIIDTFCTVFRKKSILII